LRYISAIIYLSSIHYLKTKNTRWVEKNNELNPLIKISSTKIYFSLIDFYLKRIYFITMNIIEINNLTMVYNTGHKALDNINLNVKKGEIFGFLGPNGAGKTTTIKILLGLTLPTAGSVKIFNRKTEKADYRKKIGYLPEELGFYEFMKAGEFLKFLGRLYCLKSNSLKKAVSYCSSLMEISDNLNDKINTFSKGMKQRLALAQVFLNDPELLLLDEPSSGLDPTGIKQLELLLIQMKNKGKTTFLNSHRLTEVEKLADRIGFIKKGKIVKIINKEDLLKEMTLEEAFTRIIENEIQ